MTIHKVASTFHAGIHNSNNKYQNEECIGDAIESLVQLNPHVAFREEGTKHGGLDSKGYEYTPRKEGHDAVRKPCCFVWCGDLFRYSAGEIQHDGLSLCMGCENFIYAVRT
mmetsp:Transcript_30492/g.57719  ORF Transcript_30492/g.57719 Transcript_30492/m.57719 type:complete len:111 (+) Transcript_30492:572-904(+)